MSYYYNDSIFWVDVGKIKPNPFQPRKEFDKTQLECLADSIKQYGVLQALVVTRKEVEKAEGGLDVEYELIAGERRLRAAKISGLQQVPVLIKTGEETDLMKLELAIIENIQREDLSPLDRARAFEKLANEFKFKHVEIARKVGKSREYVSNTIRILTLPSEILDALSKGQISEGHTRPLLMLGDRLDEQRTLFKEIIVKKMTVREAEAISRKIAYDKARKKEYAFDPEMVELEEKIAASLGTRVSIERRENGGKLTIDFFSNDDLRAIFALIGTNKGGNPNGNPNEMLEKHITNQGREVKSAESEKSENIPSEFVDDRSPVEKRKDDEELYSVTNFSL